MLIKEDLKVEASAADLKAMESGYKTWMEGLIVSGNYVHGSRLNQTGAKLEARSEIVSDGPFVEPKEMIGGLVIIQARDLEEAIEITRSCPMHSLHDIEVREVSHDFPA